MDKITLSFDPKWVNVTGGKDLRDGISVACLVGDHLFLASDETASLERLTRTDDGRFASHVSYPLADFFDLPAGAEEEVDVEGLAYDGACLWIVGSHSLKRKKPKASAEGKKQLVSLATISDDPNRYFLARLPLDDDGNPVAKAHGRVAARLRGNTKGNDLTRAIADDDHLAPFLAIPGKDNGFDVEGLAVHEGRLFLGLRGPVLRGHACILSMSLEEKKNELRLDETPAKHFLKLDGLGVRDLCAVGEDLLILAGPTMTLAGVTAVYRWHGALKVGDRSGLVPASDVAEVLRLQVPGDGSVGAPEGLTLLPGKGGVPMLLVTYDGPGPERFVGADGLIADAITIR